MTNGECKGCKTYNMIDSKSCALGVLPCISKTEQCPCRTCLVKVVCDKTCEEFVIYLQLSREYTKMQRRTCGGV